MEEYKLNNFLVCIINSLNKQTFMNTLQSLKPLKSSVSEIRCINLKNNSLTKDINNPLLEQISLIDNDLGLTLNRIIEKSKATAVLFFYNTDYLQSNFSIAKDTIYHIEKEYRNVTINYPALVPISTLIKYPFHSSKHLVFQEAIFPLWLSKENFSTSKILNIKPTKVNNSRSEVEKQQVIHSYSSKLNYKQAPSIAVLICAYNAESYVDTAIQSAYLQNEPADEILIMDDGSTDLTASRINQWTKFQPIRTYYQKNKGKAKALNKLLSYVNSDFILELDADDWLDYDAISTIKNYLHYLEKKYVLLYGNFRKWKQLPNDEVIYTTHAKGKQIHHKQQLFKYSLPLGPRIYRTSSLKSIHGFPTIPFEEGRLYEDVTVLHSLLDRGNFCYYDFTIYNVREHDQSITKNNHFKWRDYVKYMEQNFKTD